MYKIHRLSLLTLFVGLSILASSAQKKWTIDDILRTERIVSLAMSPDGGRVFYQTGFTADGYYPVKPSKFYTVDVEGKEVIELNVSNAQTSPVPNSRMLRWSPDSKFISYYTMSAGGQRQLWRVSAIGGEPQQVICNSQSISEYEWSPDGRYIIYTVDVPVSQEEIDYRRKWGIVISPEEKKWQRRKEIWIKESLTGNVYQLTEPVVLTGGPKWSFDSNAVAFISVDSTGISQLYKLPVDSICKPEQISYAVDNVRFFAWNPCDNSIAYVTSETEKMPYVNYHENAPFLPGSIWLYENNGKIKQITESSFPQLNSVEWNHSGNQLAFIAQSPATAAQKGYNRYFQLYMYVLSVSDGEFKTIADGMDFFRGGENMTWSGDDKEIWFVNGEGVGYNLFAAEVATGKVRHVTTGKECINMPSFDHAFTRVSYLRQSVNLKPDIYVSNVTSWKPRRITDINPWVKDYANEEGEVINYRNEGWDIEALLIKPPGFDKRKKYPLIVVVHGGPNWHKLNEWQPDWEQYPLKAYAAEGYVMLFPNFRGSANYGVDFIKTTHYDLGGQDYRDVMCGVDYLLKQGYIDEKRMGICGWSYGGFLTPAIITRTDRFKAAQFGAGLPSIEAMYGSLWTVERILHKAFDDYPWDNGTMHVQYSPLYHAHKVKTPTLIQHGDKDPRCPLGGAVLFYKALKSYGVPTVLEIYPGMGHSITEPLLYKRILTKNLEWFNKWLKDDRSTSFETSYPYIQYQSCKDEKASDSITKCKH